MIDIKDISGNLRFSTPVNEGSKRKFLLMKEDLITLKFSLPEPKYFKLGDYVEIPNDPTGRFELCDLYKPTFNETTGGYDYELRLDAYYWKWKNKKFFYTPKDSAREASWSLTDTLPVHMEVFCRNLAIHGYTFNNTPFDIPEELKSPEAKFGNTAKLISYSNTNLLDALTLIAETWGCEWWITNNIINFGRCEYGTPVDFELGVNINKMNRSDSQTNFATRIYAFGSERNIPYSYRKDLIFDVKTINGRDFSDTSRILKTSYFRESDIIKAPDHVASVYMTQSHTGTYNSSVELLTKSSSTSVESGTYTLSFAKLVRSIRIGCVPGSTLKPVNYVNYFVEVGFTKSDGTKETIRSKTFQQYIYSYAADISIPMEEKEITLSGNVTDFYVLISYTPVFSSNGSVIISYKATGPSSMIKPNDYNSAKIDLTFVSGASKGETLSCILNPDNTEAGSNSIRLPEGVTVNTGDRYTIGNIIKSRVPDHYFSKSDEEVAIEGIVSQRLMLPKDTPYIDAFENMKPDEIVEEIILFDDIYPQRVGTISSVDDSEKGYYEDSEGKKTDKTYPIYKIKDSELKNFKKEYELDEFRISFETGSIAGMDFAVELVSSDDTGTVFRILRNKDYGRELPDEKLFPKVGNNYVLHGYDVEFVSDTMIPEAEQKLKERAKEESDKLKIDPSTYDCEISSHYAYGINPETGKSDPIYAKRFDVGDRVNLINKSYFENGRQSRIIGYEYPLDIPYDHPVYTVGETAAYSRIGDIEARVESLTYKGQTFVGGGSGSGSSVYLIGTNDTTNPTNRNALSALRTIQEIIERSLSKTSPDTSLETITFLKGLVSNGLIQADGGINIGNAIDDFLTGKGIVMTPDGRIQCNVIEARQSAKFLELIYNRLSALEGDFVFSESGTIDKVEDLGSNTYRLFMRKRYDSDFTALEIYDILRGVVNNLLSGGTYSTCWLRVIDKDLSNNSLLVILYPGSDIPGGVNAFPTENMLLQRWGNTTKKERQRTWYLSSTEGRIVWLTGVTKPILSDDNYATFYGLPVKLKALEGQPINYDQPYMYARGMAVQDFVRLNYQGKPIYELVDRGIWSLSVAMSAEPYYFEGYNAKKMLNETSTVYHKGNKWQCLRTNTQQEPKWNATDWAFLEGNSNLSIDFQSSNGNSFFYGDVNTVVEARILSGNTDITDEVMSISAVTIDWSRDTGLESEDNTWNPVYVDGRKNKIRLTKTDMGSNWLTKRVATFKIEITIPTGVGTSERLVEELGVRV